MNHGKARALSDQMMIFYRLYNEKVLRKFGELHRDVVPPAQYLLLGIIAEAGRITAGELSERALMQKQQVTKALNQLEQAKGRLTETDYKGMIVRLRLPDNRRQVWLECTPQALELQRAVTRETQARLSSVFDQLEEQDMDDYLSAMQTVNRILEKFPAGGKNREG